MADYGSRWLPVNLPVGVITSIIGAPFLHYLVTRSLKGNPR